MNITIICGIKNCDTMKKAFKWLEASNIDYEFHDYKKQSVPEKIIKSTLDQHGWENVINRRGTTWRQLPKSTQETMDDKNALKIAQENPSIIKRPILIHKGKILLGFKTDTYEEIFKI